MSPGGDMWFSWFQSSAPRKRASTSSVSEGDGALSKRIALTTSSESEGDSTPAKRIALAASSESEEDSTPAKITVLAASCESEEDGTSAKRIALAVSSESEEDSTPAKRTALAASCESEEDDTPAKRTALAASCESEGDGTPAKRTALAASCESEGDNTPAKRTALAASCESEGNDNLAKRTALSTSCASEGDGTPAKRPALAASCESEGEGTPAKRTALAASCDSEGDDTPAKRTALAASCEIEGDDTPAKRTALAASCDSEGDDNLAKRTALATSCASEGDGTPAKRPALAASCESEGEGTPAKRTALAASCDSEGDGTPAKRTALAASCESEGDGTPAKRTVLAASCDNEGDDTPAKRTALAASCEIEGDDTPAKRTALATSCASEGDGTPAKRTALSASCESEGEGTPAKRTALAASCDSEGDDTPAKRTALAASCEIEGDDTPAKRTALAASCDSEGDGTPAKRTALAASCESEGDGTPAKRTALAASCEIEGDDTPAKRTALAASCESEGDDTPAKRTALAASYESEGDDNLAKRMALAVSYKSEGDGTSAKRTAFVADSSTVDINGLPHDANVCSLNNDVYDLPKIITSNTSENPMTVENSRPRKMGVVNTGVVKGKRNYVQRCGPAGAGRGAKWQFLEHRGPLLAPRYRPLPPHVRLRYRGRPLALSPAAEEAAGFYARYRGHPYTANPLFNRNFFTDWRALMTSEEAQLITDLDECDFSDIHDYQEAERTAKRGARATTDREIEKEYGRCVIDGRVERIANYRIEPPGLFRGRGDHPKMGKIKRRVRPEDVIVNCSADSRVPAAPPGHRWKEVRHDNTVTWLDAWKDGVCGGTKYVTLGGTAFINSAKDRNKFDRARRLRAHIERIRQTYRREWGAADAAVRQRAVALYLIDRLALRTGASRDGHTVGCCTLRVRHLKLHRHRRGQPYVVEFDFPGKDSIRYHNEVPVEAAVFDDLAEFVRGKRGDELVFDRLTAGALNEYLKRLMPGLTARVFRTYNASKTLQAQLDALTDAGAPLPIKLLTYNRANRAVACLCNHRRAATTNGQQKALNNLRKNISKKKKQITELEENLRSLGEGRRPQKMRKTLRRLILELKVLKLKEKDYERNKTISLTTSKLNYIDPRITVAWCKKHNVPIKKVYSKRQQEKFQWAIKSTRPNYRF